MNGFLDCSRNLEELSTDCFGLDGIGLADQNQMDTNITNCFFLEMVQ